MLLVATLEVSFPPFDVGSLLNISVAIKTDLWRNVPPEELENIYNTCPMKTHSQGAATPLVAALDPKLADSNGAHLNDCQIEGVLPWASDAEKEQELWALSEKLTGKKFNCSAPH